MSASGVKLAAGVLCLLLLRPVAWAAQVENADFGFSITIPDDFQPDPEVAATNADFIHAFTRADPDGGLATIIILERMRGRIGREKLDPAKLPPGFKGSVFTARWNDFEIEAIELPELLNGVPTINYNAQVPLKPEAIQVRVVGPQSRQAELRALLDQLLASLQGDSNWLRSSAPPALAASRHYTTMLVTALVVGIVLGLVVLWLIGRRSPRGTVLLLAVLIYTSSWAIDVGRSRELRMVRGGMRMLGFFGLVVGVVDLFRRRPTTVAAAAGFPRPPGPNEPPADRV